MAKLAVAVFGACGRMGQAVIEAISADEQTELGAAIEHEDHAQLGQRLTGADVRIAASDIADLSGCGAMIAFPIAAGACAAARCAQDSSLPLVIGTTSLDSKHRQCLGEAARKVPVLWAANMSLGVSVLARLVAQAARQLPGWDVEVMEMHHRGKLDAPSGTALHLGEAVREARQASLELTFDRSGKRTPRSDDEIGMVTLRGGDVVGEHTVYLAGCGERLALTHQATSRHTFAYGAVHAAKALAGRPAGMYKLDELLDF